MNSGQRRFAPGYRGLLAWHGEFLLERRHGVAFVVAKTDSSADANEILQWAWSKIAKYKLSRVELIDALPLNPSGKVMKFKLRENHA